MNMIIDALPDTVRVCGENVPVRTDFRVWLMLEQLLSDDDLTQAERVPLALNLVYLDKTYKDINEAVNALIWFYRGGNPEDKRLTKMAEKRPQKRVYDIDQDAEYIFAAFMQTYGIDLTTADLHWWQFRAMLHALPEDCLFSKIMGYRAVSLSSIKDKETRARLGQKQALYRLRTGQTEEEKIARLYDSRV